MKHNRKYKLLKDLPDGAIVGDIYVDNGYGKYTNQRMDASKSPVIEHNSYFSWQVETSTDFFEEVNTVEKGYQDLIEKCKNSPYFFATNYLTINGKPFSTMLSEEEFNKQFLSLSNPEPSSKKEEGWEIVEIVDTYYSNSIISKENKLGVYSLKDYLTKYEKGRFKINAVLRKSDNTVFTVGDENIYENGSIIGKWTIKGFEINNLNDMMVTFKEHNTRYNIDYVSKAPTNTVEDSPFVWTDELVEDYSTKKALDFSFNTPTEARTNIERFKKSKTSNQ